MAMAESIEHGALHSRGLDREGVIPETASLLGILAGSGGVYA